MKFSIYLNGRVFVMTFSQFVNELILLIFNQFVGRSAGVVGWCEGVVYLTSPGRPTDIGLQFGKAC